MCMRRDCGVEEVTVNKPNPQAVGLYRHMGVYRRIDCGEEGPLSTAVYAAGKPPELKTVHDPGGHWPPGSWRLSEKPGGFFRQKVAVCCAHNLCAIGAQIPHLQPEKYFLSRTCRERK